VSLPEFDLTGKVAVVTGAGRSIGRATARALAEAGADVALAGRTVPDLERVAGEVEGVTRRALVVRCDVSMPEEVDSLFFTCAAQLGPPDVVIANAGTFQEWGPSRELTLSEWDRVTSVNLRGAMLTCRAAGSSMIDRTGGSIVTIGSIASIIALPGALSYVASKFGLFGITRTLAAEWAEHGIRVNCLAPGFIERDYEPLNDDPETLARIMARSPMARWGQPREVALAATFLASPASSFITGAVLPVDGGWLAV
jgi:2-deoxy-D-gluconate 3-dehydrogenase